MREDAREDTARVREAELLLVEALRTNPALAEKLGTLRNVSGEGHSRVRLFEIDRIEFRRTAHFDHGDLTVNAFIPRKQTPGKKKPMRIRNWHQYTGPHGEHALTVDM